VQSIWTTTIEDNNQYAIGNVIHQNKMQFNKCLTGKAPQCKQSNNELKYIQRQLIQ